MVKLNIGSHESDRSSGCLSALRNFIMCSVLPVQLAPRQKCPTTIWARGSTSRHHGHFIRKLCVLVADEVQCWCADSPVQQIPQFKRWCQLMHGCLVIPASYRERVPSRPRKLYDCFNQGQQLSQTVWGPISCT